MFIRTTGDVLIHTLNARNFKVVELTEEEAARSRTQWRYAVVAVFTGPDERGSMSDIIASFPAKDPAVTMLDYIQVKLAANALTFFDARPDAGQLISMWQEIQR